jgi:hypothetical protein
MPVPRYTTADALAHDFEPGGSAGRRRYTTSKLCNIYCAYEYARRFAVSSDPRLQSLRVNTFDPGLMPATGLARTYSPPLRFVSRHVRVRRQGPAKLLPRLTVKRIGGLWLKGRNCSPPLTPLSFDRAETSSR